MESFLLLTVLGAIIGLFTIQPDYKKLRLAYNGYSVGKLDMIIFSGFVLEMLFFIILGSFLSYHSLNITTNHYLFLVDVVDIALIMLIFICFIDKFYTKKIRLYNKINFIDKWDELFYKEEYNTLIFLIKDNYRNIMRFEKYIDYQKLLLDAAGNAIRMKKELENHDNEMNFLESLKDKLSIIMKKDTYKFLFKILKDKLIKYSPKVDDDFLYNIEMRLLDYNFVKEIVRFDPYFGIKIVTDKEVYSGFREDFAQLYFRELIVNRESVLYREVLNTQSFKGKRYEISQNNRILHQILSDIKVADENEIYTPIGKSILDILDKQGKEDKDLYNEYDSKLMQDTDEKLKDPIFLVVHFFDIMIREALYQKVEWHMFLHYYSYFVEKISNNYKISEDYLADYEFPNIYSMILWEIFHNLISWIKLIETDLNNINLKLENTECEVQNDNIIKNSIFVLVECVRSVLDGKYITFKVKNELIGNVLELYTILTISKNPETKKYGKVLECCLLDLTFKNSKYKEYVSKSIDNILDPLNTTIKLSPRGYGKLSDFKERLIHL